MTTVTFSLRLYIYDTIVCIYTPCPEKESTVLYSWRDFWQISTLIANVSGTLCEKVGVLWSINEKVIEPK